MKTETTVSLIKIRGRDNWTEAYLDRLEAIARGPIIAHRADGAGRMDFWFRPRSRLIKADREAVAEAFKAIGETVTWVDRV